MLVYLRPIREAAPCILGMEDHNLVKDRPIEVTRVSERVEGET